MHVRQTILFASAIAALSVSADITRAVWTGAQDATTWDAAANWRCYDEYNNEVGDAVPSATTPFIELAADADWRAQDINAFSGNEISLDGHRLDLTGVHGVPQNAFLLTGERAYKYYRFTIENTRGTFMQMSELKLFNGRTDVTRPYAGLGYDSTTQTVQTNNGAAGRTFPGGEPPEKAVDGTVDTKWLDFRSDPLQPANVRAAAWLTVEYGVPRAMTGYQWYTANDTEGNAGRNLTAWRLQGSNDNEHWDDLDAVADQTNLTTKNKTLAFTGQTHSPTETGEVHFHLGEDVVFENDKIAALGNLRMVIEGAGTYQPNVRTGDGWARSFDGGFELKGGYARPKPRTSQTDSESSPKYGQFGTAQNAPFEIFLDPGTVFDIDSQPDWMFGKFYLNGGLLQSTGWDVNLGWNQLAEIELGADSRFIAEVNALIGYSKTMQLSGYTFTAQIADEKILYLGPYTLTNGTFVVTQGEGILNLRGAVEARTVDLRMGGALNMANTLSVRDYTALYAGTNNQGAAALNVYGRFTPATDRFYGCTLQDGAVLDLSDQTDAWPSTSASEHGRTSIDFGPDAAVLIDLGSRTPALGACVVSWSTLPVNADGTTFTFSDGQEAFVTASGIFYGSDPNSTEVARAVWTNAAGDGRLDNPANWTCANAAGREIADGLPGASTSIHVSNASLFDVPAGTELPCGVLICDEPIVLAQDLDWRGLDLDKVYNGTQIDLAGHKMYVTGKNGISANALTVTSPSEYDAYRHFRFVIDDILATDGTTAMQIGDVCLFVGDKDVTLENVEGYFCDETTKASDGRSWPEKEYPALVWDCKPATKWLDFRAFKNQTDDVRAAVWSGVSYTTPIAVTRYDWWTANDTGGHPGRNPLAWRLQASNDKQVWVDLHVEGSYYRTGPGSLQRFYAVPLIPKNAPGEFHVDVPAGSDYVNTSVKLTGNVKLVKEGEGVYEAWCLGGDWGLDSYLGGTQILAGTVKNKPRPAAGDSSTSAKYGQLGPRIGYDITVAAGATFDITAAPDWDSGLVRLAGGTLASTGYTVDGWGQMGEVVVTDDAAIDAETGIRFTSAGKSVDLGGHTVTAQIPDGKYFWAGPHTFQNGTLKVGDGGTGMFRTAGDLDARTVNLDLNCRVEFYNTVTVNDLTIRRDGNWGWSSVGVTARVYGRFRPVSDYFPNLELQDGATLDLSDKTEMWSLASRDVERSDGTAVAYAASFAPNARITVDIGARHPQDASRLVAWTAAPEGVRFSLPRGAAGRVAARADGLYYYNGFTLLFR